jgi:hypothetical protein
MLAAASSAGVAGVKLALKGSHPMCLQEAEVQPQQLAVVVDSSFSTVQDLIDNTACMVRVMCSSCQSDNWKYSLAESGQCLQSAVRVNCLILPHTAQVWIASSQVQWALLLGVGLLHPPAFSLPPGQLLQGAPASEAAVRRLFQQLVVGVAFCHRQVSLSILAAQA